MCDNRKSRRSSILKIPKQRTPLCDVDFNPPTRRVSFANSNFIKEFTADPEKNTIWHNSYEESINSIKDTEKEEEIIHNISDRDDFNSTRVEFFDEENSLVKNSSDDSITSARVDLNNFKDLTSQNVDNFILQEQPQFQEISYKNDFLHGQQPSSFILPNLEFSQMKNEMSRGNIQDMSDISSTSKQQTFLFNSTASNDNMDFTQAIPTNFANLHLSKQTNAEITRSIPPNSNLMRQILNAKRDAEQKETALLNSTQKSNIEMNVTQCVSTNTNNKRQTIFFNEVGLDITSTVDSIPITIDANKENISQNNEMEITESIPQSFNFTNTDARKSVLPNRRTLLLQENYALQDDAEAKKENIPTPSNTSNKANIPQNVEEIEITQVIPASVNQLIKSRRQTINYNTENIENSGMEITESIPQGFNFTSTNARKSVLPNRRTLLLQENYALQDDAEAKKENIPTPSNTSNKENIPQNVEEIEITQVIPASVNQLIKSRRQTINYNTENIENSGMEITESIPQDFNFTSTNARKSVLPNRRTLLLQENYALQDDAEAKKENIPTPSNKENIPQNVEEIEITQVIPASVNQLIKSRRQTINYNTENIENSGMEITESIPQDFNFTSTNARKSVLPNRRTLLLQENYALQDDAEAKKKNIPTPSITPKNNQSISFNTQSFDKIEKIHAELINENLEMTTAIYNNMQQKNNRQTINFNLQNDELVDMKIENIEVTIANSNNLQQENSAKKRTIHFKSQNEGDMAIVKINKNQQHISDMSIINTENMEMTTAITNKFNMQQKNTVKNHQTINFNLQNEESDADITNTINLQQISRLTENIAVATANSNKINLQQKNPTQNRQTINFNHQIGKSDVDIVRVIPDVINLQQISQLTEANIENMEIVSANSSKINLNQKKLNQNRQTINFNHQIGESDVDIVRVIPNVINLQQIPQFADVNIENMEIASANSSKINLPPKNLTQNRHIINFNHQIEESDVNIVKVIPNDIYLQQIHQLTDINIENMEIDSANSSKTNLYQKNRQTIHVNHHIEESDVDIVKVIPNEINLQLTNVNIENIISANSSKINLQQKNPIKSASTGMAQDVPCSINVQLVNEISTRGEDNSKMCYSSAVKEGNNAENLTNNSTINQKEQLFGSSAINSNSTVKQKNIDSQIDDYPAPINFVTKKPCSSSIRHTINLQADKSVIIINDSTASKITDDKRNTFHLNNINNDCASSVQTVSLDESCLKISPNNSKDSLKNVTELSETKMVLNQITDLLKEKNVNYSTEDIAKDTSEAVTEKNETIFHFKGYPLVLNQAANESGKSDICQRIKYLGETQESFHRSNLNFTSYSNTNSCNISKNLSSLVDSTEKLINYKPQLVGASEYTKIINEDIVFCNISKRTSVESVDELANVPHKVHIIESNITSHSDNIIVVQDDKTTESVDMSIANNLLLSNSIISINSSSDNDSTQKEDDSFANELENSNNSNNETLWKSVVEKSKCYNSEILSSVDISLVDSSDSFQTPEVSNINATEERQYTKPAYSVIDIFREEIKIIKNKYPKPKRNIVESSCSAYSIKQLNPTSKITEVEPEVVTVHEQIKQKSQDALWSIKELKDDLFSFTFMYNTIEADSQIETDTGIVKDVKFYSTFSEKTSEPTAIYCYQIVIKKITRNHIKSAIGSPYTILSLLDYISMIEEQILSILHQFENLELQYGVDFNADLNVKMQFTNIYLSKAFEVMININKLDNLTEEDVIVTSLVGQIDKFTIKRLIKQCPRGVPLLNAFILNVKEYLKFLQNNR